MTIDDTLAERGQRYGAFQDHAAIAQRVQHAMEMAPKWSQMPAVHQRALTTIADKIARILNGDPNYIDNWHDIQGYAKLVEDWLTGI